MPSLWGEREHKHAIQHGPGPDLGLSYPLLTARSGPAPGVIKWLPRLAASTTSAGLRGSWLGGDCVLLPLRLNHRPNQSRTRGRPMPVQGYSGAPPMQGRPPYAPPCTPSHPHSSDILFSLSLKRLYDFSGSRLLSNRKIIYCINKVGKPFMSIPFFFLVILNSSEKKYE